MKKDIKVAYLCNKVHPTIILLPGKVNGTFPKLIKCSHINCGNIASLHFDLEIDDSIVATHEFYKGDGKVLTKEEIEYLDAGGLLFKTIAEAVPKNVINEFMNTNEMIVIGTFITRNRPNMAG